MSTHSVPSSTKPAIQTLSSSPIIKDIIYCFQSIHLAIVLLSLLAIGTMIGVVMPQEGMVDLAQIEKNFGANFKFYHTLGFFNVFSSFWFLTLQVLFFFNLLIGSFKWLKPATLAAIQKFTIAPDLIQKKPDVFSLATPVAGSTEQISSRMSEVFKSFRYRIHQDTQGNLYASKGNLTRLGPSLAHVGILLCLVAGFYSCFTGFKAVKMAVPGQTFAIPESDTFKTNVPMNVWMGQVPEWKVAVKDFRIEFYEDHPGTAKQYYSTLQVQSPDGKVLKEQVISVNHPLVYDDVSIYQASFAPTGRFYLQVNGRPLVATINNQFNDRPISMTPLEDGSTLLMFPFFAQQDPGVTENFAVFMHRRPGEPFGEGKMPENIRVPQGQSGTLGDLKITYERPEISTGLQIKRAPEVTMMYLSYLIIAIGTVMCFFSQRQVWVSLREISPERYEVLIHPKTNKARLSFRNELLLIQNALGQSLRSTPPLKESTL